MERWLVVWLHGMDHGFINPEELETMQRRHDMARPVATWDRGRCTFVRQAEPEGDLVGALEPQGVEWPALQLGLCLYPGAEQEGGGQSFGRFWLWTKHFGCDGHVWKSMEIIDAVLDMEKGSTEAWTQEHERAKLERFTGGRTWPIFSEDQNGQGALMGPLNGEGGPNPKESSGKALQGWYVSLFDIKRRRSNIIFFGKASWRLEITDGQTKITNFRSRQTAKPPVFRKANFCFACLRTNYQLCSGVTVTQKINGGARIIGPSHQTWACQ